MGRSMLSKDRESGRRTAGIRHVPRVFSARPGASAAGRAFQQSFEQVDAAERWGLDASVLGRADFAPERSVPASPLIMAAAIAPANHPL